MTSQGLPLPDNLVESAAPPITTEISATTSEEPAEPVDPERHPFWFNGDSRKAEPDNRNATRNGREFWSLPHHSLRF